MNGLIWNKKLVVAYLVYYISLLGCNYNDYSWVLIILLSIISYGDITPVTIQERIYTIFIMLTACAVFAYSMSSIGEALKTMDLENMEWRYDNFYLICRKLIFNVNKFMKRKKLPSEL